MPTPPLVIVLIVAGVALAGLGALGAARHHRRLSTWRTDRATVVGYDWGGTAMNKVQHWILERTGPDGRPIRSRTTLGTSWGSVKEPPFEVDVLVDPDDETRFVPRGGCRSGTTGLVLVVAGVGVVAAAFFVMVLYGV